ncbi:dynein regulatory complex protein 1 homolog [Musca vetustissima]|uniref:dynein regulatory complex protein 1 homolog n=1 Tax=Musca vetustissima TaxID=27455 RepID=UPI002AB6B783|nr:dynein regulatory complex protein 1 homolog [Musca vetustissima]
MENCNDENGAGGDSAAPKEEPSQDSLKTGFIPYVGNSNNNRRNVKEKLPHIFDLRSKLRKDKLQKKLKDMPQGKAKNDIELQLEQSDKCLQELLDFGNELVNNIKAANEQQELLQCRSKKQREEALHQTLRTEAAETLKLFDEINAKWLEMNEMREPMAIFEEMQKQRENIAQMMSSKDELIEKCQEELRRINAKYDADQQKQSQDVCFLVERIDDQIELLKKSYKENLYELQEAIDTEKKKLHQASQDKWSRMYTDLTLKEEEKMELVKEKQELYSQELEKIRTKQEEITRATRIRLEKDAEMLELEIRKTRANILINSEKIDYNYQVLQKRNEENIIINNQQKRRVAKFNESIVLLKRKLESMKQSNRQVMERYTEEIQKLHASINELQLKSEHFRKSNRNKFTKVWAMHFKEIKDLLNSVWDVDRILYEQQLGRKWERPAIDMEALDYTKPKGKAPASYGRQRRPLPSGSRKPQAKQVNQRQLQDILQKISDRAGFLIEERLLEILKPYTDEEKCLVRIENIFAALNITDMAVVNSLISYFEPYSWCPNCSEGINQKSLKSLYSFKAKEEENSPESSEASPESACSNHILVMEPALVLTALNEFTSQQMRAKSANGKDHKRDLCLETEMDLLALDEQHILSYWQQFSKFMPQDKQNLWKTIEHGLNHYLEVLKKRSQLDGECVFLQKQNSELKYLLQKL